MNTSLRVSGVSLLIGALIIPVVALAAEFRQGQSPSLSASETSKGDLYLVGGNVSSAGKVQGDLVAGGGSIIVSGSVSQDLLIGGGSVTVVGDVGDDVRAGGGNILINGKVGNDVVVAGGSAQISGSGVGGDVLWAGGTLQVMAPVGGNMQLAGGEVTINSRVRGNVEFKGTKLTLGKDASIDGNLTYSAKAEATFETGAVVKGKTTFEPLKTAVPERSGKGLLALISIFLLGKFLMSLVFALVLGLVFHRYVLTAVRGGLEQPLLETGRGLIVLIVLPVASVLALVTIIGIPFGVLGLVALVALAIFASGLAAITAGSLAYKLMFKTAEYEVSWKTILLGVVIYTLLGFIPFVGWLAKCILFLIALGAMTKIKMAIVKEWR